MADESKRRIGGASVWARWDAYSLSCSCSCSRKPGARRAGAGARQRRKISCLSGCLTKSEVILSKRREGGSGAARSQRIPWNGRRTSGRLRCSHGMLRLRSVSTFARDGTPLSMTSILKAKNFASAFARQIARQPDKHGRFQTDTLPEDSLIGIWVRVSQDGKLIGEYALPTTAINRGWDKK